jgi:hypothetical protein
MLCSRGERLTQAQAAYGSLHLVAVGADEAVAHVQGFGRPIVEVLVARFYEFGSIVGSGAVSLHVHYNNHSFESRGVD